MKRLVLGMILVGFAFETVWANAGKIEPNAEKIAAVKRGEITEALASWWGFNPEDSTDSLQKALDSGVAKLTIDRQASDWITKPLELRSHMEIFFDEGVTLVAKRGEFKRSSASLFTLCRVENVSIHGNGGALKMWKEDYLKPPYDFSEWRHAIRLETAKNILIENIFLVESGGDGVYVGATYAGGCENITLRNVIADGNNRQGISVISVDGLFVENCVFKNTGGAMPMAGVDFEPNAPKESLKRIVFRNCLFDNNKTVGITFFLLQLNETSEPLDILFENCVTHGNEMGAVTFMTPPSGTCNLKGSVKFKNCRFENDGGGITIRGKGIHGNALLFKNIKLVNVATTPSPSFLGPADNDLTHRAPIQIFSDARDNEPVGGIVFDHVEIIDPIEREFFQFHDGSSAGLGIADVTGSVSLRRNEEGPVVEKVTLDKEKLATLYPEMNPRHIMPLETTANDFAPYNTRHNNEFPYAENAPGIRARFFGHFQIFAQAGETVKFKLQEFSLGDFGRNPVIPEWTSPDGTTVKLTEMEYGGTRSYEIPVTKTGVYKLMVKVIPHDILFSDSSLPFVYCAEPSAMMATTPGTFYFNVPEGTMDFGVKFNAGLSEPFATTIIDPFGKKVWENPALEKPLIWTSEKNVATGIWTLKINAAERKSLEGFRFTLLGIPPFLATQRGAVFVKQSE